MSFFLKLRKKKEQFTSKTMKTLSSLFLSPLSWHRWKSHNHLLVTNVFFLCPKMLSFQGVVVFPSYKCLLFVPQNVVVLRVVVFFPCFNSQVSSFCAPKCCRFSKLQVSSCCAPKCCRFKRSCRFSRTVRVYCFFSCTQHSNTMDKKTSNYY